MTVAPERATLSPEAFTERVRAGTRIAEMALQDKLAAAYAEALRSVAADVARRFTVKTTRLTAAAYDPTKHPRHPATGPDRIESPTDGGKWASTYTIENARFGTPEWKDLGKGARQEMRDDPDWQSEIGKPVTRSLRTSEGRGAATYSMALEAFNAENVLVARKDGQIVGVLGYSFGVDRVPTDILSADPWLHTTEPIPMMHGGNAGAIKGGGLPLFKAAVAIAADEGRGLSFQSTSASDSLYRRLGVPGSHGEFLLTPEQVQLLSVDGFALAREQRLAADGAVMEDPILVWLTAAADPTREPQFIPPDPNELVPKAKLAAEIEKRTRKIREQIVAVTVANVLTEAGISFDIGGIFSDRILKQVGLRARDADLSTRDAIRTVIGRAQAEGWTVPETAAAIKEHIVDLSDSTATQLARTDLIGTSNASADAAAHMVFEGRDDIVKRWTTADDERVRPSHEEAEGQTVPMSHPFTVGGALLDYPGDPDGPDAEVIQCRCVALYLEGEPVVASVWRSLTAAFNPAQPRNPATGADGIESPSDGGKFAAKGGEGRLDLKSVLEPASSDGRKMTETQVKKRAQQVADGLAEFYGGEPVTVRYEPEATAAWDTDARTLFPENMGGQKAGPLGKQEIWFGQNVMDDARDPDFGVAEYRKIAHEAAHASVSGAKFTSGFAHEYEEGAAEILSINYWDQRGQPFDARDAVRVDGRWTAPGTESLAHSVVYRDNVKDVMRRTASSVGWNRDAIVNEVERVMKSDSGERIRFRDSTDPEFPLPEGVDDDAVSMIQWMLRHPDAVG